MFARRKPRIGNFRRLWSWFKNGLIQDVPEDIEVCELECRKPQCRRGEWETCERRLRGLSGSDREKGRAE